MHLQSAIVTSSSSQVIYLAKWPAWLTALRVDQRIFFDDVFVQFAKLHNLASWMQLNKMLCALLCLISYWGSWCLSTVYWIYEYSPIFFCLLVHVENFWLRSANTDLGVANLHDFPGTESFPLTPEQQWPSDCHQLTHIFISKQINNQS